MSVEVLLLSIMVGITLIGYMIAVNAHGSTRLSISYLLATVLLAGTVWAIVQYVNSNLSRQQQAQYRRLEAENSKAEERIKSQEQSLMRGQKVSTASSKVNNVISQGTGYAASMMNANMRDFSVELDVLMGRATAMKRKVSALNKEFKSISSDASYFPEGAKLISDAIKNLSEASNYYKLYFRAEDSVQEELRERLMRQKARAAYNQFSKAGSKIRSN
jgi:hypothetical protein